MECVQFLIDKGADIKLTGPLKMGLLNIAAAYDRFEIVKWLVEEKGVKILAKDKYKRSALTNAVRNGNLQIVSYLLSKGAEYILTYINI